MLSSKYKGIVYIIISAFFFALMNTFVKLSGDLPTFQKALFRNLIAAVFAVFILLKNKSSFLPKNKKNIKYFVLRTVFGLLGVLCNFYCLDYLIVSDASILNKVSPFFAIIFSFFIIKEKPKVWQYLLVAGAFLGAVFVIKPSFNNAQFLPSLIGFIGGASAGMAYTFVRKLGTLNEDSAYIVFFFSAFSTIFLAVPTAITYKPMTISQVFILLGAGFSAALGQIFITYAYTNSPPKEISIYDYTQIIFAAVLGFVFFNQLPDIYSIIGYIIIVSMAVINFLVPKIKNK